MLPYLLIFNISRHFGDIQNFMQALYPLPYNFLINMEQKECSVNRER